MSLHMAQRSLDDLGTPLHEVTFVVFDLETTGESVEVGAITEIGAVKLRGGECLGTFQSLVDPGRAIPPHITVLTGITEAMVYRAPRIEQVLPTFLEFVGDAVVVGHNIRYDLSFMNAALERHKYSRMHNRSVDTLPLARRLLATEVPNCKLGTLARALHLDHQPLHRALDDAWATGDLLHFLLARSASIGVLGLQDLFELPKLAAHPQAAKLALTEDLPRSPGVYAFFGRNEQLLYIGKASDVRQRVRSYFSGEQRRKIAGLLRETVDIRHAACSGLQEAEITELRLIREHLPRYNRQHTRWKTYRYLKLTLGETFPRLVVARTVQDDGGLYLGPFSSQALVTRLVEAIQTASKIRRCRSNPSQSKPGACASAQLGVSRCPCSGEVSAAEYSEVVSQLVRGLTRTPAILFDPLMARMQRLAAEERFEEAAEMRDRMSVLAESLRRQRQLTMLREARVIKLSKLGRGGMHIVDGQLVDSWGPEPQQLELTPTQCMGLSLQAPRPLSSSELLPLELVDEMLHLGRWLEKNALAITIGQVDGELASIATQLPNFKTPNREMRQRR